MNPGFYSSRYLHLSLVWSVVVVMTVGICEAGPKAKSKPKPAIDQEQQNVNFQQAFTAAFYRWDRNHDGKIDLKEVNAVIEDPQIHGDESALAAVLRRRLHTDETDDTKTLTLPEVQALADDPQIQRLIIRYGRHIQSINHSLFLPEDPNLANFHQGGMGDCYLLAVIGSMVYEHPQAIRAMVRLRMDGGYDVHFGNGRDISVAPVTDAELLMGATEGSNHGIWLSVLEKAYAHFSVEAREAKTGEELAPDDAVVTDLIGRGGYYAPVISRLTGHKTAGVPTGRWLKEDPAGAPQKLHDLLVKLTADHRLMATGTRKDKTLPKGIPHGHVLAVLDYSPTTHMVRMFNPWGNHVKPTGPAGLVNGYPTEHGIFEVPAADFLQIFSGFTYETDKPVKRS